jgi:uncharacterized protein (DUF433 family)
MGHVIQKGNPPVTSDPEIMSGAPVFRGTRVPIETLIDYLIDGFTIEYFLQQFPTVPKDAAIALLEHLKTCLLVESPR